MFEWMEDLYESILGFVSENPYVMLIAIGATIIMNAIVWKSSMWADIDMKTKVLIAIFSGPIAGFIAFMMRSR